MLLIDLLSGWSSITTFPKAIGSSCFSWGFSRFLRASVVWRNSWKSRFYLILSLGSFLGEVILSGDNAEKTEKGENFVGDFNIFLFVSYCVILFSSSVSIPFGLGSSSSFLSLLGISEISWRGFSICSPFCPLKYAWIYWILGSSLGITPTSTRTTTTMAAKPKPPIVPPTIAAIFKLGSSSLTSSMIGSTIGSLKPTGSAMATGTSGSSKASTGGSTSELLF